MCCYKCDIPGDMPESVHKDLDALESDGLVTQQGHHIEVTETGRPFIRRVAACFDAYWTPEAQHHAKAV